MIMVTTRSADKRLDAPKEEDLVLRSRRIGSPRSTLSTPSRASKRTASTAEDAGSPHVKRLRSGHEDSTHDGDFHVVVNVPIKSTRSHGDPAFQESIQKSDAIDELISELDNDKVARLSSSHSTPTSALATNTDTPPDQKNETFRTPATSRHKRFDSEEIDDDTILASNAIDSLATQGYQTAEEEINASDDDAPEMQTTKTAPTLPQRKSARTPRAKKNPQPIAGITDGNSGTIEVVSTPSGNNSSASGNEIDSTIAKHDKSQQESTDGFAPVGTVSSMADPQEIRHGTAARSLAKLDSGLSLDTVNETLPLNSASEPPLLPNATLATAETNLVPKVSNSSSKAALLATSVSAHSQFVRTGLEVSSLRRLDSAADTLESSNRTQMRRRDPTLTSNTVQLPLKPNSSLSIYRRDKLQQKVAGSAGGFNMQSDWPKKRSSFVVS